MVEKFNWYVELLKEGEKVVISPVDYGDFIRYVSGIGGDLLAEFERRMNRKRIDGDEAFPILIEVSLT